MCNMYELIITIVYSSQLSQFGTICKVISVMRQTLLLTSIIIYSLFPIINKTTSYLILQVVELLNQASLEHSGAAKVILLKQVQELVINKEPNLLDNFFDVCL